MLTTAEILSVSFEETPGQTRLANDGLKCSDAQFGMVRYRDRSRGFTGVLLHNNVAAATTDFGKPVPQEDSAHLLARKHAQPNQSLPPDG